MPRDLDDDASSRMNEAYEQLSDEQRQAAAAERSKLRELRHEVKQAEWKLAHRTKAVRIGLMALIVAGGALLTGLGWTVLAWGSPATFLRIDIICGTLILIAATVVLVTVPRRGALGLADMENARDTKREELRFLSSLYYPTLKERRSLYREDVAGVIEQHRADSRKYRLVHNALQNLIMIGSAATTTVAALDTGGKLTWQNVTIVAIGFTVTLSAAFTGYYKYRERSYFLLQTADAIEEEANAVTLGIGPYKNFGPDQEQQALKLFTQRVEDHRNEQRRRQQQLDQPADQGQPTGASPSA
ncbi:SLATT domain-containing protein [Streptomyces mirabilis]|uniref:SLATT domain-containing protein n=1 Tax=Streptomyces mirabilis TaxID=68239 RepID=UPI0036AE4DE6